LKRLLDRTPSVLLRVLATAAVVVVLIPTCSMAACAMDMDLAALMACDSMWFASDAESGILVALLAFAALALFMLAAMPQNVSSTSLASAVHRAVDPHPPDDPLVGRLRL
jgi:hypothetical protein